MTNTVTTNLAHAACNLASRESGLLLEHGCFQARIHDLVLVAVALQRSDRLLVVSVHLLQPAQSQRLQHVRGPLHTSTITHPTPLDLGLLRVHGVLDHLNVLLECVALRLQALKLVAQLHHAGLVITILVVLGCDGHALWKVRSDKRPSDREGAEHEKREQARMEERRRKANTRGQKERAQRDSNS
jgi:hypothetical protein